MQQIEVNLKEGGTFSEYSITCFTLYKLRKKLLHQYSRVTCLDAYAHCHHRTKGAEKQGNTESNESYTKGAEAALLWTSTAIGDDNHRTRLGEQSAGRGEHSTEREERGPKHCARGPPRQGAEEGGLAHGETEREAEVIDRYIRMLSRVLRMKTHPDRACKGFHSDWFTDVQSATVNRELWVLVGFLSKINTKITEMPLVCLSHIFHEINVVCRYLNRLQSDPAFIRFGDPKWWCP